MHDEKEEEGDDDEKDDAAKQERPFSHFSSLPLPVAAAAAAAAARVCSGMVHTRKCAFPRETDCGGGAAAAGKPRENRKSAAGGRREEKQRSTVVSNKLWTGFPLLPSPIFCGRHPVLLAARENRK